MDLLVEVRRAMENPQPPDQRNAHAHGNLIVSPLDVFSLPFRYIHRHETLEFLAEQYGVTYEESSHCGDVTDEMGRSKTISLLLHNSIIFLAIYWAPRYLAMPFPQRVLQEHTHSKLIFRECDVIGLMGDCVEVISVGSLNLFLQLYLYSSKLEHIHSLKLFVFVTSDGLIAFRSALFGGASREPQGLEQVLHSPVFKEFLHRHPSAKVIAFLDRGFTRTTETEMERVFLLFPTSGEKGSSLTPDNAAWRQVCDHAVQYHLC